MSAKRANPSRLCPICDRKWYWQYAREHDGLDECPRCEPRDEDEEVVVKRKRKI